jgi:putative sterol carrier protein
MKMKIAGLFVAGCLLQAPAYAQSGLNMMSGDWGTAACAAWNTDPVLTGRLVESGWVKNDKGRGFKVVQMYRTECEQSPRAELHIALKDGKAQCVYGGLPKQGKLDFDMDYIMHAETPRWVQMGAGEYGPMRAMMFGRLSFQGPMGEAMGNMGPFESFLLLVGKVPSSTASCPGR